MGVRMVCWLVCWVLGFGSLAIPPAQAQAPNANAGQNAAQGPRRHLSNIIFAGLAGAVLGLSTLSFYGRPQDRLSNIAVGFAIGVIGGTVYSTYKAAAEPRDFYGQPDPLLRFVPAERQRAPQLAYTFEF